MSNNNDDKKVNVLAYEKKMVPSDGYLYGGKKEDLYDGEVLKELEPGELKKIITPLTIREKSVRGTISNRLKDGTDESKIDTDVENANPQTVDCCFLNKDDDTLIMKFTLKVLGDIDKPTACSNGLFLQFYKNFYNEYNEKYKFDELAYRYAYSIATARFLWRNRLGSDNIDVLVTEVKEPQENQKLWHFNAKDFNLRDFPNKESRNNEELNCFANSIQEALSGESFKLYEIMCFATIGKGQEVYPSQEMILGKQNNKKDNKKSKILYSANECAAFHSQKIGNAIRTIDTWYDDFNTEEGVGPIAVDSYGAVTTLSKAFRKSKNSFFSLMDTMFKSNNEIDENQKHYFMAMIIRGGVFGESKDDDRK